MSRPLFRQQALSHLQHRLHGDVLVLPKLSHGLIGGLILLWFMAVLVWLFYGQYARQETVQGWLEPTGGVAKHYSQNHRGIVKTVHIQEGEAIIAGQALLTINGDRQLSEGMSVEQALLNEYQIQLTGANNALRQQQQILTLQTQSLQQQIQAAKTDLEQIKNQQNIVQQRYDLVNARIERLSGMQQQGHVAESDLDVLQEQRLAIQSEVQALTRDQLNQTNRMVQLRTELQLLPQEYASNRIQLQKQASELTQQITQVKGQREYTVIASRDGIVSNLHLKPGQSVNANQALLSIVPSDSDIAAQLLVPVRAAGFLFTGQQIDIRYDAFPYQKFGLYEGELTNISSAVLLPNDLPNAPIAIQEPMYLVKAKLNSSSVEAFGKPVSLKPGMTFSADIELSERSLIEWVLEPIFSLKGRL